MEPFSTALGIISVCTTTASILSFLASTVSNLAEKQREWAECKMRLSAYKCNIETCRLKLEAWKKLWFDYMRDENDYTHFWGCEGFRGVQERIGIIEAQCKAIRGSLPMDTEPSEPLENPSPVAKAAFALVKSAGLKDRISRLKEMLGDLEDYSNTKFHKIHNSHIEGRPSDDALNELLQLKEGRDRFAHWMNRLHDEQISTAECWSLILQIPVGRGPVALEEEDLDVDFLVEERIMDDHRKAHIVKLVYNRDEAESRSIASLFQTQERLHSSTIEVSRRPLLSPRQTPAMRKSMHPERSRMALGLATWAFPLIQTPWTTDLCSCVIHLAVCENSIVPILDSGSPQRCNTHRWSQDIGNHTFLLLGTTLAELVLAEQIRVGIKSRKDSDFEITFQTDEGRFDEKSLLLRIKGNSPVYMQAVKYCFELDRDMIQNRFLAQDAKCFMVRVIKPLQKYFRRIEIHSAASRKQSWYQLYVPGRDSKKALGPSSSEQPYYESRGVRKNEEVILGPNPGTQAGQGSTQDAANVPDRPPARLRREYRKLDADRPRQ